ncbi:PrsW family intramembrane metalloprotease [Paractinoplanes brasiliensis]|uniref:RsiW-degrading membrane proteinase PrsW (M82 family) n=1 Tax=Paractinoplanes brasiliensis TaxID=52695 RepID=A0A4R6J8K4_9ACTN|nr:PrsW family intramembrane metalloprotease [Actinoplanes brasiliensis]TDO31899.1 RsiW-degrading membrane proteinase PrsW (M82 family) [Actinoplanes brasiliensis]GID27941.1 protease PrsW [Actinoplanes brasiliensis]
MTITGATARTAQLAAIDQSGWGTRFKLFQPHNAAFWVWLAGVGIGAVGMIKYFGAGFDTYRLAVTSGILFFGIYLVPWLFFLRHQNRYTAQPGGLLATGFVWGAFAATFWIALPANAAMLEIWSKLLGPSGAAKWGAGLTAPINEEWGKALGLILLIGLAPALVRSAYDGFIIGAFIGLGFQVSEDILYAYNNATSTFGENQLSSTLFVLVIRGFAGITSHALFSAVFCAGVMWILGRAAGERHVVRGVLACLAAMFLHFAWDDVTGLAFGNPFLEAYMPYLIIMPLAIATLLWVRRQASTTERRWTRDLLAPEVEAGVVDGPLLDAVSGLHSDRRHFRKLVHNRHRAALLIESAGDLAQELAAARGEETPRVAHARQELLRLRGTGR